MVFIRHECTYSGYVYPYISQRRICRTVLSDSIRICMHVITQYRIETPNHPQNKTLNSHLLQLLSSPTPHHPISHIPSHPIPSHPFRSQTECFRLLRPPALLPPAALSQPGGGRYTCYGKTAGEPHTIGRGKGKNGTEGGGDCTGRAGKGRGGGAGGGWKGIGDGGDGGDGRGGGIRSGV